MPNLRILPPCMIQMPGTEHSYSLTFFTLEGAASGVIGALGARLVTHLSPKLVGGLFALAALVHSIIMIATRTLNRPKDNENRVLLAFATCGLSATILCHKTVVPLTVPSAVMFSIMTAAATACGLNFAASITKSPNSS